jgi:hypothetical protein
MRTETKEVTEVDKAQEILYAMLGAGDFAVEKAKGARKLADPETTQRLYEEFVKRGRVISTRVRNSSATKQAMAQTKVARSQVKAAATSVSKAVRADAKAAKQAPKTATKAS